MPTKLTITVGCEPGSRFCGVCEWFGRTPKGTVCVYPFAGPDDDPTRLVDDLRSLACLAAEANEELAAHPMEDADGKSCPEMVAEAIRAEDRAFKLNALAAEVLSAPVVGENAQHVLAMMECSCNPYVKDQARYLRSALAADANAGEVAPDGDG